MIDLHTHSSFSDGSDTPTELAQKAYELGISAIALTDHDTTASYPQMSEACERFGVELVSGVEVSLRDNEFPKNRPDGTVGPRNVHVLGYFVPLDPAHPLQLKLASLRQDRDVRNAALVKVLNEKGFDKLTIDYLALLAGNVHSIGRPHFARAMFELHPEIVGERTDEGWNGVFVEWLGSEGKAYVPKTSMAIEEFVDRFGSHASKSKQAQSRVKQIEKLEVKELKRSSLIRPFVRFEFEKPSGRDVLRMTDVAKAFGKGEEKKVVFDRGGYLYHGRVKALADAAREAGLDF